MGWKSKYPCYVSAISSSSVTSDPPASTFILWLASVLSIVSLAPSYGCVCCVGRYGAENPSSSLSSLLRSSLCLVVPSCVPPLNFSGSTDGNGSHSARTCCKSACDAPMTSPVMHLLTSAVVLGHMLVVVVMVVFSVMMAAVSLGWVPYQTPY